MVAITQKVKSGPIVLLFYTCLLELDYPKVPVTTYNASLLSWLSWWEEKIASSYFRIDGYISQASKHAALLHTVLYQITEMNPYSSVCYCLHFNAQPLIDCSSIICLRDVIWGWLSWGKHVVFQDFASLLESTSNYSLLVSLRMYV